MRRFFKKGILCHRARREKGILSQNEPYLRPAFHHPSPTRRAAHATSSFRKHTHAAAQDLFHGFPNAEFAREGRDVAEPRGLKSQSLLMRFEGIKIHRLECELSPRHSAA